MLELLDDEIWLPALIVMVMVGYGVAVLSLFVRFRERKVDKKRKFFSAIREGLANGSIEDVVDLYKGIYVSSADVTSAHYGLSTQLRQFLVDLLSKELHNVQDDETILAWKDRVSEFIRISEERTPFEGLPDYERNVLRNISNFVEMGDQPAIKRKLLELGGILHTKSDNLNRIRGINRWSIPISLIGLVLTVLFGFIAIIK